MVGGRSKGPNDKEAKRLPPGVSIGTHTRSQLPPDIIGRLGHLPAYVLSEPGQFAGKDIGYREGKFVPKDR